MIRWFNKLKLTFGLWLISMSLHEYNKWLLNKLFEDESENGK